MLKAVRAVCVFPDSMTPKRQSYRIKPTSLLNIPSETRRNIWRLGCPSLSFRHGNSKLVVLPSEYSKFLGSVTSGYNRPSESSCI